MGYSSVVLMIILSSYIIITSSTGIEVEALKAFKSLIHLHHSNITLLSDWTDETHHCNWSGIACHPLSGLVVSICLGDNQLRGQISPYLGNLSTLQTLDLGSNSFYGSIPAELGFLANLQVLDMSSNLLSGSIPENICNCTSLSKIDVSSNSLTGTIPSSIGILTNLQIFAAFANDLVGVIPVSVGKLGFLKILDLSRNKLVGSLRFELGHLVRLQILQLANNKLSSVNPQLGLLKSLKSLDLHSNLLSGSIPEEIGGLEMVETIDISNNCLSGSIPLSLQRCRKLILLDLSGNRLSNGIPADVFSEMDFLTTLNLSGNVLVGQLPIGLPNLQHLHSLDLSRNSFSGMIPNNFTNFISLRYLNLSFNRLDGPVPAVGVFQNLSFSSLSGNLALCGTNLLRPCGEIGQSTDPRGFLLFVSTILTCGCCFRKHRRESSGEYEPPRTCKYSENDLEVATNSYHQDNLIEQREFCAIYKGTVLLRAWNESIDTPHVVAVKRWDLLHHSTESSKRFLRELSASSLLKHRNLVKLIGYSWESGIKAIVLEYMKNGSLESLIHDPNSNRSRWTFSEKLRVCVSVAHTLLYMSGCGVPVHFNLKPSNVLFDEDWEPHLSNFGTSQMLGNNVHDGSSCSTATSQSGSCYLAPEFGHINTDFTKATVYSFGMLVLEVLTSRRPTETIVDDEFPYPVSLREFVDSALMNGDIGRVLQLADPDFASTVIIQEEEDRLMDLLKLALSCVHLFPDNRPKMTEVLSLLVEIKII